MLTEFQQRIARVVLAASPDPGLALAGGAAVIFRGLVERGTTDLDFFTSDAEVERIFQALSVALVDAGLDVEPLQVTPTFVRLRVGQGSEVCLVDVAQDLRMMPADRGALGLMIAAEELAADKMLALFSRAYARDFVDVYFLARRFGRERLCALAAEKDPGFDEHVFADMLGSVGRLDREEFDVDDTTHGALLAYFDAWRGDDE